MSVSGPDDPRTLIALEPRLKVPFHPLYHEICKRKDLTPGAKVVYAVLCSYLNIFKNTFPGREVLAADTGMSAHQLVDATKSLVSTGLLHVKRRGFGQTNVYTLLRWPSSPVIPRGITDVPSGISGDSQGNLLPIEEEEIEEASEQSVEEQDATALWHATLDQLAEQYHISTGNLGLLRSLPARLERGALVVRAPADMARMWAGIVGRVVRFET